MAKPKVTLKIGGIRKVLREAQPEVDRVASRKAAIGGDSLRVVSSPHRYTARAYIETKGLEGAKRQAREHILEQIVGGAAVQPSNLQQYTTKDGRSIMATPAQIAHWTRGSR